MLCIEKGVGGEILSGSHQDLGENEVCGSSLMGPLRKKRSCRQVYLNNHACHIYDTTPTPKNRTDGKV